MTLKSGHAVGGMPRRRAALLALGVAHQVGEAREQIVAVARAGRCFRMVLHREHRLVLERQAAVRAVEQRHMRFVTFAAGVALSTAKPWFIEVISTLPVSGP